MKRRIITNAAVAVSAGLLFTACSSMHHERKQASYSSGYQNGYASESQQSSVDESSGAQGYSSSQSSQDRSDVIIPLHEERLNVSKRTVDAGQVTIRKIVTTETINQPIQLRKETLVIDRDASGSSSYSSSQSGSSRGSAGWQPGATAEEPSGAGISASAQTGSPKGQDSSSDTQNEPSGAATESSSYGQSSSQSSASVSANAQTSGQGSGTAFQEQTFTIRLQEEQPMIEKNIVQTGRVVARKNSQTQQQNISQQIRREDVQLDKSAARNVEIRGNFDTASGAVNEPSGAQRPMRKDQSSEDSQHQQQSIQSDSSETHRQDSSVNESSSSLKEDRTPTQGLGAQDLKEQPEQKP